MGFRNEFSKIAHIVSDIADEWARVKNPLQKSFNKAAGLIEELSALHQEHPKFEFNVETSKSYSANVGIQTNIPYPSADLKKSLEMRVYYNGDIKISYGAERHEFEHGAHIVELDKTFSGRNANKKAAAFIKEKAATAGLI
jgi:hypothetical protein